jgi:hypothetical protein
VLALAPVQLAAKLNDPSVADQVALTRGPSQDVVQAAARHGFSQMTVPMLDKLMTMREMRFATGKRPARELDVVVALVENCIPNCSSEDVAAALAARKRALSEDGCSMLANPANLEKLEEAVDEDDYEIIKKATKHLQKVKANVQAAQQSAQLSRADAQQAQPAAGQEWRLRPLPAVDDWTLHSAKDHLPNVHPKATLSKDVKRFSRWSGTYPKAAPCTVSKSWGPRTGFTVHSALCYVLHQLWVWHEEETGDKPPFDFLASLPNLT